MFDRDNPPVGFVGYANSKSGLLTKLQHWFAGPGASHSFVITYPIGTFTEIPMVFEANLLVRHNPYARYLISAEEDYHLFMVAGATDTDIAYSLDRCTKEFSGVEYGFLQLLWFPYRWFMETILRKDVRKSKNWFTDGVICSELWWWYCWYLTERYPEKWAKLRSILSEWNPDTFTSYDVKGICENNPDIFIPFVKYTDGVYTQLKEI